jgi:hypothetical protein
MRLKPMSKIVKARARWVKESTNNGPTLLLAALGTLRSACERAAIGIDDQSAVPDDVGFARPRP